MVINTTICVSVVIFLDHIPAVSRNELKIVQLVEDEEIRKTFNDIRVAIKVTNVKESDYHCSVKHDELV